MGGMKAEKLGSLKIFMEIKILKAIFFAQLFHNNRFLYVFTFEEEWRRIFSRSQIGQKSSKVFEFYRLIYRLIYQMQFKKKKFQKKDILYYWFYNWKGRTGALFFIFLFLIFYFSFIKREWPAIYGSWNCHCSIAKKFFRIHLWRHLKRFNDGCIITEFDRKVNVKNHPFWLVTFSESMFFWIIK